MRHANSNLNIYNKYHNSKTIRTNNNNFLKTPSSYGSFRPPITSKNGNNKHILYNLLYKDTSKISLYNTKNSTNVFNSNKNLYSNNISIANSQNLIEQKSKHRNKDRINIRLKLNNEIINNNYRKKTKTKNNYDNMIEKIKEKDFYITKLQKDLLLSQELLNQIQNNKQKELSFTYNSIKNLENFIQNTEKSDKIIKPNFANNEIKRKTSRKSSYIKLETDKNLNFETLFVGNYNKNRRNKKFSKKLGQNFSYKNFLSTYKINNTNNNHIINNNIKYNLTKTNYLKYFSSSPNRYIPKESIQFLSKNKQKNGKVHQTYSNTYHNKCPDLKDMIEKCNVLKERTNNILDKFIKLIENITI